MILFASMPALAETDIATDLSGEHLGEQGSGEVGQEIPENSADMQTADLIVGYVAAADSKLNPILCTQWNLVSLNQLVFESVVELDETMKPTPMLADSWKQEGKKWTFKLRSGVRFHNGYDLTAYDVAKSYEMYLQAGARNPYYERIQLISSMEATDTLTLTVNTKYPGVMTLYAMTFPVIQYSTLSEALPRGTGPYWYIQYDGDGTIRLEANPLWWKNQPNIQSVLFKRYFESGAALEALQTNQIQMLSTKSHTAGLSRKLADLTSMDFTTYTYELMIPNLHSSSIMSDINVRQAVMYAIDRAIITSNAYLDMATQSEVPVQPGSWLYESQSAIYYYSPERALQLMNASGWQDLTGDGRLNKLEGVMLQEPNISIITYNESTNSIRENAANLIASYLEAIGINTTVTVLTQERLLKNVKGRDYDIALVSMNLSEMPVLQPLLSSGGSLNLNKYDNAEMDALLSRVASATTEAQLKQIYSEIQMIVVDRLPIMGLLFRGGTVLSSRSIGGLAAQHAYDTFNGMEFLTN